MDDLFEFALSIKAIERELDRRFNELVGPLGITAAQADALVVIGQAEPLSLGELGELLIAEGGHPSRLVDRLVEAGWVDRRTAGGDRRRIELSLTPQGRKLARRIEDARENVKELGRELIPEAELQRTLKLFRKLLTQSEFGDLIARRRQLY